MMVSALLLAKAGVLVLVPWVMYAGTKDSINVGKWSSEVSGFKNTLGYVPTYPSKILHRRCLSCMTYDDDNTLFVSGPIPILESPHQIFSGSASEKLKGWTQLDMTANFPWSMAITATLLPRTWQLMSRRMSENVGLYLSGFPVLDAATPSSCVAFCLADINNTNLQPVSEVNCSFSHKETAGTSGEGHFRVSSTSAIASHQTAVSSTALKAIGVDGDDPKLELLQNASFITWLIVSMWIQSVQSVMQLLLVMGPVYPVLSTLLLIQVILEVVHTGIMALNVFAVIVYKARMEAATQDRPQSLWIVGTALVAVVTRVLVPEILCLLVSQVSAQLLVIGTLHVLVVIPGVGELLWLLNKYGGHHSLATLRCYIMVKLLLEEVQRDAVDVVNRHMNTGDVIDLTGKQISSVTELGSWPSPIEIPDSVDALSESEIPRGFVCSITKSIMRQPALLLHDGVTSFTYDKQGITNWLKYHSTEPRSNVPLKMSEIRLVYNLELAQNIEEWVSKKSAELAGARPGFGAAVGRNLRRSTGSLKKRAQSAIEAAGPPTDTIAQAFQSAFPVAGTVSVAVRTIRRLSSKGHPMISTN